MASGWGMDGLLSVHSSLPLGFQSQTSSVLVHLDNWAQLPTQQLSGICYFWEGTSYSGGGQPSRVRAWSRRFWVRVTDGIVSDPARGRVELRRIHLQIPIVPLSPPYSCQSPAALRARMRRELRAKCSPAEVLAAGGCGQEGIYGARGWVGEEVL